MNKLLIFHPALAPYRVDQFNMLSQLYDLDVVFIFENLWNHKFDQTILLSQLQFKFSFLLKGPHIKGRVFRFGILKTIKKINPDIILGYEYSFTTQYLILLKRFGLIHQKIGSTIDDSLDICNHVQSKIRYFARQNSVKYLDYLIVMSRDVSQYYQNVFNINENRVIISPILQKPERLRNNDKELEIIANKYLQEYHLKGKKVMLFVGRFIPEKALLRFISNIQFTLQEQENLVLVLVGDGKERKKIELLVKKEKLEEKVILPGRYEGPELSAWYLCASGFVLPSLSETFGAVVNEALIFGLTVLCSKYAGASCLIESGNGLIFDPLDEKKMIEDLNCFLRSIYVLEKIDVKSRPSLMSDFKNDFNKEWRKLEND